MKAFVPNSSSINASGATSKGGEPISVQCMGQTIFIEADVITVLEGEGNYSFIYTKSGKKYLVSKTLKSLSECLNENFIRVHKSYLVNAEYVVERTVGDRTIRLVCGKEVAVSRRKTKEIAALLDHSHIRTCA